MNNNLFAHLKSDFPAGLVVFLVALPLCLGIALASGAPLFSGLISGIVGGLIIGTLSGSHVSVSGPAAGLTVIVLDALEVLGSFEAFLVAVVLAGVIQFLLGIAKAGIISHYFPSSVIKGMLAAIGLILIMKQIPHAIGWDADYEGDLSFFQPDGENTFSEIIRAFEFMQPGAFIISTVCLGILLIWELPAIKRRTLFKLIPGGLVAVIAGILLNQFFQQARPEWYLLDDHMVSIPVASTTSEFIDQFTLPDFGILNNINIYISAFTIAIVASLETLLCIEATDKLDPYKRITSTNRELRAQGIGNIVAEI
jgi:MFS superfamily sulfate permease-like transporter